MMKPLSELIILDEARELTDARVVVVDSLNDGGTEWSSSPTATWKYDLAIFVPRDQFDGFFSSHVLNRNLNHAHTVERLFNLFLSSAFMVG